MVEPEDPAVSQKIVRKQVSAGSEINSLSANLPAEIIAKADKKVQDFAHLKAEINSHLDAIRERFQLLRALLMENMQSDEKPLGLLNGKDDQYLARLDFKQAEQIFTVQKSYF